MPARVPVRNDVGAALTQETDQFFGGRQRRHRVVFAIGQEDPRRAQVEPGRLGQWRHGREQHRLADRVGSLKRDRGGDVGAVREPDRDEPPVAQLVVLLSLKDEVGQLVCPLDDVFVVEDALGQAVSWQRKTR